MTIPFPLTPQQLQAEHQRIHTKYPQLLYTLTQISNDALRTYITLHYAYHNLSQNTTHFTSNSHRLLAALQWIHISTQDHHELSLAIHDAQHILAHTY